MPGNAQDEGTTPLANIFTVPPGAPFLRSLANAILSGNLPRPGGRAPERLDLPAWTILMPTRRAARTLQEAFIDAAGGGALLLPAIRAIAEGQEDLGLIESAISEGAISAIAGEVPPAISSLDRILLLTQLVQAWSEALRQPSAEDSEEDADIQPYAAPGATTAAQAARLAAELARLIDMVETENVALDRLATLVPDAYSAHWQQTLEFLKIITDYWPAQLAERRQISAADRRNRLILDEARRLRERPPQAPVIVAGVTGSVPATAELMRAVAALANGAIVLPGLDQGLDDDAFARVAEKNFEHPQHGLARLLAALDRRRQDVAALPGTKTPPDVEARNGLVAEAMRPSGTMSGWRRLVAAADRSELRRALDGVSLIEAQSDEDEAEIVALALREAAEAPGVTAALVSPDRLLSRRVAARLEAWGIRVDDSAGRPFAKTVPGSFLDLLANAIRSEFAPAPLMALLKHPLTRLGLEAGDVRRRARNLEIAAFRATYLGRGLGGVMAAVDRARTETLDGARRGRAVRLMQDAHWDDVGDLLVRLREAAAPAVALAEKDEPLPLATLVGSLVAAAEAIAAPSAEASQSAAEDATSPLWARDEGEAASQLLSRLMAAETPSPKIKADDFPEFFRALVGSENIRTRVPAHPRLFIWGPYEARLHQPDIVILGALNEGVWPQAADPGPWLNRGMRAALGLPSPEEETGRAAHDLTQLLGTGRVIMTRANKSGGVPMVASRWLLRLKALLGGLEIADAIDSRTPYARWARGRDVVPRETPIPAPAPKPDLALRPRRLSVSDVETWLANPYAIFAGHILRLDPLPILGQEPGPSERGQIVHETLARFTKAHPDALPRDIVGTFMAIADEVIGDLGGEAKVRAFWRPRLARFAEWFAATEAGRRRPGSRRLVELSGRLVLAAPGGPFELRGRADRIDFGAGGIVISDYKTGAIPNPGAVLAGESPQLPLEAVMAGGGAFAEIEPGPVTALRYIRATGGEPPGEEKLIEPKDTTIAEVGSAVLAKLEKLVAEFDRQDTPYRAMRRRRFNYDYDDYAHLARVGEWSADDAEGAA